MASPADIPPAIADIAAVAGWDVAWALVRVKGGQRIFIPAKARRQHWLARLVGFDAAQAICELYRAGKGGSFVAIPSGRLHQSKLAMVKALEEGGTANEAAAASGMHVRSAYRARRRMRDSNDLFSPLARR